MKRRSVLLAALLVCLVAAGLSLALLVLGEKRYENDAMIVTWKEGIGKPLTVEGIVVRQGSPAANQVVNVETGSGASAVMTGPDGRFSANVGELELTSLGVQGAGRIEWGLLRGPSLRDGVSFRIELK
jgi:hypothetical protein